MPFFAPPPRLDTAELIDSDHATDADFAGSFADIARVNRFLGGTQAVVSALSPLISALPDGTEVRVLDIATGSADIPRALVTLGRRGAWGRRTLRITATDNHSKVLALARRAAPPDKWPEIAVSEADALLLPFENGAFHFALCSMAFHHFGPQNCVVALQEMERVTTHGFVVNDLLRDRTASALIWLLTRLVRAHPMTRHDAPASVMRAYTLPEYEGLCAEAGISPVSVRAVPMFRAVLTRRKGSLVAGD